MRKKISQISLSFCLLFLFFLCVSCRPGNNNGIAFVDVNTHTVNQLVGVDHFGRSFQPFSSYKADKQVGLFFWIWIGQPYASGIYDATQILNKPEGLNILTGQDVPESPNGQAHFWGEPLWQYYNSEDEWVIRKQMQMLTLAGIDFIYFDTTNALIYKNVVVKIMEVIREFQQKGWTPPKIVFYTHSKSIQTTQWIYRDIYQLNLYPETWYMVEGKPMIIAYTKVEDDLAEAKSRNDNDYNPSPLSEEILDFFHFYKPQWPSDPSFDDGFPWVEWSFPQPLHTDVMNVTVASHPSVPMTFTLTQGLENWGRGWNPDLSQNITDDAEKGTFFQRQWDRAIEADPGMISIGGWNEWIAYKQPWGGEYMLCDAANLEFSRDIEPMNGGYQDAFYIQMIQNIRRYKGVFDSAEKGCRHTIRLTEDDGCWDQVAYRLANIGCDDIGRDSYGASQTVRYEQPAPQHILQEVRVANDKKNIYFYIRCQDLPVGTDAFSPFLLIGTGDPTLKAWESYEFLVGQMYDEKQATIHQIGSGFSLSESGNAEFVLKDNLLQIRIPREAIGANEASQIYFKVAVDVESPEDIMSYYTSGSAMPMGRLSFLYKMN